MAFGGVAGGRARRRFNDAARRRRWPAGRGAGERDCRPARVCLAPRRACRPTQPSPLTPLDSCDRRGSCSTARPTRHTVFVLPRSRASLPQPPLSSCDSTARASLPRSCPERPIAQIAIGIDCPRLVGAHHRPYLTAPPRSSRAARASEVVHRRGTPAPFARPLAVPPPRPTSSTSLVQRPGAGHTAKRKCPPRPRPDRKPSLPAGPKHSRRKPHASGADNADGDGRARPVDTGTGANSRKDAPAAAAALAGAGGGGAAPLGGRGAIGRIPRRRLAANQAEEAAARGGGAVCRCLVVRRDGGGQRRQPRRQQQRG